MGDCNGTYGIGLPLNQLLCANCKDVMRQHVCRTQTACGTPAPSREYPCSMALFEVSRKMV